MNFPQWCLPACRGAGGGSPGGELRGVRRTRLDQLMSRIGSRVLEQDDLLRTAWTVRSNDEAQARLFDRLAEVCVEQLFLDLDFRHTVGELGDDDYLLEVARLITQCRTVGITPPVSIEELHLDEDEREAWRADQHRPPSSD